MKFFLCFALLVGSFSCGGQVPNIRVPIRADTPGGILWKFAPVGADLVVEVDLARVRSNPTLTPLLKLFTLPKGVGEPDLLSVADVGILCVYDIANSPKQLILLYGELGRSPALREIAPKVFAFGDETFVLAAEGLQKQEKSMLEDRHLLTLRAKAMPEGAKAAILRASVRLDFNAQVSVAARANLNEVPQTIGIWGDVVDDLAVVIKLGTVNLPEARRLQHSVRGLLDTLAKNQYVRFLGVSVALKNAKLVINKEGLQVVIVIGPKRLKYVVAQLNKHWQEQSL